MCLISCLILKSNGAANEIRQNCVKDMFKKHVKKICKKK